VLVVGVELLDGGDVGLELPQQLAQVVVDLLDPLGEGGLGVPKSTTP